MHFELSPRKKRVCSNQHNLFRNYRLRRNPPCPSKLGAQLGSVSNVTSFPLFCRAEIAGVSSFSGKVVLQIIEIVVPDRLKQVVAEAMNAGSRNERNSRAVKPKLRMDTLSEICFIPVLSMLEQAWLQWRTWSVVTPARSERSDSNPLTRLFPFRIFP